MLFYHRTSELSVARRFPKILMQDTGALLVDTNTTSPREA